MLENFNRLKSILQEIQDLSKASAVLRWDQQTKMPKGGAAARTRQLTTLSQLIHTRSTSDEMGDLLESLDEWRQTLDPDSLEAALVRLAQRDFMKSRAVPADLVRRQSQARGEANGAWQQARAENDFSAFLPHIQRMFELAREYAACFPQVDDPYDALLDRFEEGLTRAEVSRVFNEVKRPQSALLKAIVASGVQIDDRLLRQHFPEKKQLAASLEAAQVLGYDLKRGRLDLTTHPFATSFSTNDVRITTRVYEDFLNPCLFGTLHETGHALYELGVSQELEGLPIARGTSSGVHESQSRLFENLIGRNRDFAGHLLPILQRHFPSQLGAVDIETFYRAINRVQPSFIRVEADEVSYNLHIIIRFEIETALLDGSLDASDLPEVWAAKFQEYLGVTPPDDTRGVLQDVHWSWGLIGHFQSYAIGNIIASLWWKEMETAVGDLGAKMAAGNIAPIREWLAENVHQHGRKYPPTALIQRVTGAPFQTGPYISYLQQKFGALYGL
jgi:carboxypeptidase Taq